MRLYPQAKQQGAVEVLHHPGEKEILSLMLVLQSMPFPICLGVKEQMVSFLDLVSMRRRWG